MKGLKEVAVSRALGVDEDMAHTSIRFGIGRFTTEAEIDRAVELTMHQTLENCGWDVLESCAGVSMVANPFAYLNKIVKLKKSPKDGGSTENDATYEVKLDDINIREAIFKATGLCINSSSWTGIPGYCRFTVALE
nr:methionine s-methyltransferase [Quercus suber]